MLLAFEPAPSPDGVDMDVEAASDLLSQTAWDGALPAVREARARVFAALGLPEPTMVGGAAAGEGASAAGGGGGAVAADENASYGALLAHAARGM